MNSRQIAKYNKDIKDLNQSRNKTKKKDIFFSSRNKEWKGAKFYQYFKHQSIPF